MLVLTRRTDESICLGDNITITVLSVESDKVKIGISAPKEMKILRKELMEEVTSANKEAVVANMAFIKSLSAKNKARLEEKVDKSKDTLNNK